MLYAICDCDNCFVSCERVFRPDLEGRPVVVLSNNDGCIVSRSREAKAIGVKMGMPLYQMRRTFGDTVVALSSNYELYADMTARVMSLLRKEVAEFYRYSVDEAFCILPSHTPESAKVWGEKMNRHILRATGMPVSIGVAPTKTLAKIAAHFAKTYPGYHGCCLITDDEARIKALSLTTVGDVWGIGRHLRPRLERSGIRTALDFAQRDEEWIKGNCNITVERTWRELNGQDCIPEEEAAPKKSILNSRSFQEMVTDLPTLRTYVANFASSCAAKLRKQNSVAGTIGVFISTNRFRTDLPQYHGSSEYTLSTPTDSAIDIVDCAMKVLDSIYRPGYLYKRAGVVMLGIRGHDGIQPDLFDYSPERADKLHRLDTTIDSINRLYGRDTIVTLAQVYQHTRTHEKGVAFGEIMRHDLHSANPTTRWTDIIRLK